MNIGEVKDKAIKYINYYSVSGNIVSSSDPSYLDYSLRMNSLIDTAQKEIATTAKSIRKQTKISQNPITSQICNTDEAFDIEQHLDEDITYEATGSRAYTFKVDNVADIYIEQSSDEGTTWTLISTVNHLTPTGYFTEYKGLIIPASLTNLVRLRFSGSYIYNFRDIALFAYTFPNSGVIPQYRSYNLYTMPSDFYKLIKVTFKGSVADSNNYNHNPQFYWEQSNILALNYYSIVEATIDYKAMPTTITDSTLDSVSLEIDTEAQEAIPYYVAAHLMMDENGNINNKLYAIYQGKISNLDDSIKNGQTNIKNTLFRT